MFKSALLLFALILTCTSIEAQTISGCTDAGAMNYNILAEEDSGSCFSEGECNQNFIEISHDYITAIPDLYMPYEIINSEGIVVETGAMNGTAGYNYACLEDGCYTIVISDIPAEWSGIMSITVNEPEYWEASNHSSISGQDSSTFSTYIYVNDYSCNENTVEGCTHYLAINYNPDADIYDGSCIYDEDCEGNEPIITYFNGSWNITDENGEVVAQGDPAFGGIINHFCIPDGCYTFEITANNNIYNCNFELYLGDQLLASSESVSVSGDSFEFQINSPDCQEQIEGCTDPEAVNFNPDATIDDGSCEYECEHNQLTIHGLFAGYSNFSNLSWSISNDNDSIFYNEVTAGSDLESTNLCLPDGCYTLTLDLSEDGSNYNFVGCMTLEGENLFFIDTAEDEITYIDFAVNSECEIEGCTNPEALNYYSAANVDDGSCEYSEPCDYNQRRLDFSYSGPALATPIHWQITTDADTLVEGYYFGWLDPTQLCIPDGCYTLTLSGLSEEVVGIDYEISTADGGVVFLEGQISNTDSVSGDFAVNSDCAIEGCTDPDANNYDQNATVDDGSCTYSECEAYTALLIVHAADDTLHWEVSNSDSVLFEGLSVNGGGVTQLCLPDDCYNLTITDLSDFGFDGSYAAHIYQAGAVNLLEQFYNGDLVDLDFGINSNCTEIEGCTDPEAINFIPEATIDDGSCIYEPECSINFDLLADSSNLNTIFVIPADSIGQAVDVLWDFGDGTTSTDLFPYHEYEGDGPYNLCLTIYFEVGENDTCDATFCMEIDADMIPNLIPGTSESSGFFINIIEDSATIGIDDKEYSNDFTIFPNPVSEELKVSFKSMGSSKVVLLVHDLSGKLLKEQVVNSNSGENLIPVDFSGLSSGIYLVTLRSGHKSIHKKVVKE